MTVGKTIQPSVLLHVSFEKREVQITNLEWHGPILLLLPKSLLTANVPSFHYNPPPTSCQILQESASTAIPLPPHNIH